MKKLFLVLSIVMAICILSGCAFKQTMPPISTGVDSLAQDPIKLTAEEKALTDAYLAEFYDLGTNPSYSDYVEYFEKFSDEYALYIEEIKGHFYYINFTEFYKGFDNTTRFKWVMTYDMKKQTDLFETYLYQGDSEAALEVSKKFMKLPIEKKELEKKSFVLAIEKAQNDCERFEAYRKGINVTLDDYISTLLPFMLPN